MPFSGTGTGIQNANDVFFSGLSQGQQLHYNSSTAKWNNVAAHYINVRDYGVKADGTTDDTVALINALAAANSGGTVALPAGVLKLTGDITITADKLQLVGSGDGTKLSFTNGGLIVDGATTHRLRVGLRHFSILRAGSYGPALHYKGGGSGKGPARWYAEDIHVEGSSGEGLLLEGAYIGTFHGCYWRGSHIGIRTIRDGASDVVGVNAVYFYGGEVQQNTHGIVMDYVTGAGFYGMIIEGNSTSGVTLGEYCRNVGFFGGYCEANGGWDIRVGYNVLTTTSTTQACAAVTLDNIYLADGPPNKSTSVYVNHCTDFRYNNLYFSAYLATEQPIKVQPGVPDNVTGVAGTAVSNGATVPVLLDEARCLSWQQSLLVTATLDFPAIASGGAEDLTVVASGARVGDDATVHINSALPAGMMITTWVSADDTVTARVTNAGVSTVDLGPRTVRVRVFR
jgi:hypothetical protein